MIDSHRHIVEEEDEKAKNEEEKKYTMTASKIVLKTYLTPNIRELFCNRFGNI